MTKPKNIYADILQQTTDDFSAVRDGRRSMPFYYDVDLSVARSGVTSLILPIAGNSFYIDANPNDGNAFVEFQDTANDTAPAPLYVSPGSIFNVPFTQIRLQNPAQPAKRLRIAYGVDIDFQPGSISQVAFSGSLLTRPESPTNNYFAASALAINTAHNVFLPGANINGAVLLNANAQFYDGASSAQMGFIYGGVAPTFFGDGAVIAGSSVDAALGSFACSIDMQSPQYIPANQGLYFIAGVALGVSTLNYRSCRYKLL